MSFTPSVDMSGISPDIIFSGDKYSGEGFVKVFSASNDTDIPFEIRLAGEKYVSEGIKVFSASSDDQVPWEILFAGPRYTRPINNSNKAFWTASDARLVVDLLPHRPGDDVVILSVQAVPSPLTYLLTDPKRDGIPVQSVADVEEVAARATGDEYVDNPSEIYRIDVIYVHELGVQHKIVVHEYPDFTTWVSWSPYALPGLWLKREIRIYDFDGAESRLSRFYIGNQEDVTIR